MKQFSVELTGHSPIILHGQDLNFESDISSWRKSAAARKSAKGDDRSPAFTWLGYLYHDGEQVVIPTDNLMTAFREGGAQITSRGKTTFKALTQSGARIPNPAILKVNGATIPLAPLLALKDEADFLVHQKVVRDLGFTLLVKGCKVGMARHIRVRPYFANWTASFVLDVWDDNLTQDALQHIWNAAGQFKGIGDWRPGSPKSGQYGTFTVTVGVA